MENTKSKQEQRSQSTGTAPRGTLGTFAGVFTPSVLTILGIILFLRLGYVVGNGCLGPALLILFLANLLVFAWLGADWATRFQPKYSFSMDVNRF